jgi:hypothetical protein
LGLIGVASFLDSLSSLGGRAEYLDSEWIANPAREAQMAQKDLGWSVDIQPMGSEQQIALQCGGEMLWLDAEHARQLAGVLESKADELDGLNR